VRLHQPLEAIADRRLEPMTIGLLDAVMAIEKASYAAPWTRGNFIDSLAAGHIAQCLFDTRAGLVGYCVAMPGAGELHLLNLTVTPSQRRRGHARHMLDALTATCRDAGMTELWLEVRVGNERARQLYRDYGLEEAGLRKAYYPAASAGPGAQREDAVVMKLTLGTKP
jgi:[ribosomal protein S18]-alanine N-acetyltransferase